MLSRRRVLSMAALVALPALAGCGSSATVPTIVPLAVPLRLYTQWTGRPDGPLPRTGDEGVALTLVLSGSTVHPAVRGGALVGNLPDAHGAAYLLQSMPSKVLRIGATFGFGPGEWSGSIALVAFVPGQFSGHCHVVVAPDRWIASVLDGGGLVEIGRGPLTAPLPQDGTPQRVEVEFVGPSAILSLPDSTRTRVDDPRIERLTGTVACWEFYRNAAGGADVRMYETWAG